MLMEPISISLCTLINQLFQSSEALSQSRPAGRLGARARELFLNRNQACGCLSELAYISQAEAETKGQQSEGSSCYLVSLRPRGRKRGKGGAGVPFPSRRVVDGVGVRG